MTEPRAYEQGSLVKELARTREALRAMAERARDILEHARLLCFVLDGRGVVIDCNATAARVFGMREAQLIGDEFVRLAEPGTEQVLSRHIEEILRPAPGVERSEHTLDLALRTSEGRMDTSASFLVLRAQDGAAVEIQVLLTDTSELRRLQKRMLQADRLASVGQLAAGVAHEINNPAAFVMANLSHLQSALPLLARMAARVRVDDDPEAEALAQLLSDLPALCEQSLLGMRRIRDIVRDLQIFARREDEQKEVIDLNALCDTVSHMAWPEIRRHAQLEKDYGELPRLRGNKGKLSQMIMNLVINAAQAIPEGAQAHNRITLRTRRCEDGVTLQVTDTGAGIPRAVRERIFDPFFTTKPPGKGTGLGLSLCHDIVASHGGRIEVMSEVGVGSTFSVWLPESMVREQAGPAQGAWEPAPQQAEGPVHGKVLVVDDEPDLLRAMARTLSPQHEVLLAGSSAEAEALLSAHRDIDVVLCDVTMPECSGIDMYESLPAALRSRFIFISGDTGSHAVRTFLRSVEAPHLDKPVEPEVLRRVIEEAVQKRR